MADQGEQPKITVNNEPSDKGKKEAGARPKGDGKTPKTRRLGDEVKASPATRRVGAPGDTRSPGTRRIAEQQGGGRATPAMRRLGDEGAGRSPAMGRSPGMSRVGGTAGQRVATPAFSRVAQQEEPIKKKKGFFSDVPPEEELTPYESWTTGELAPRSHGIDVGMRARAARETGPGGTGTAPRGDGGGVGGGAPRYIGPDVIPGETREEREMRLFLARGEGTVATHSMLQEPAGRKILSEERPGTVRPGSVRPGSVRPGSVRPGSVRPEEPAGRPAGYGTPGPVRPPQVVAPGVPGTPGQVRAPGTPGQLRPPGTPGQIRVPGTPGAMRPVGGIEGDLRRQMFTAAAAGAPPRAGGDIENQYEVGAVPLTEKPSASTGGQLSPYEGWDSKLQPDAGARRTIGYTGVGPDPIAEAADAPARQDLFQGVSARARTTVYQFIWEMKLRCFSEGEILEQELRKEPEDRVYLKLLQPQSMDALRGKTASRNPFMQVLHFVDGTMPQFSQFCRRNWFLMFIDAVLRGAGQNMMCNNPIGGAIAIGAIFAANAWVACMACFGLVCSTLTAYILGVNRAAWQGGLFGYNGLLFGAACGAMMAGPWEPLTIPIVFVGATFTSILNLAFGNMLAPIFGAPPLALAFVFMTWIVLGAMYSWQNFKLAPSMVPHFPGPLPGPVTFDVGQAFQAWVRGIGAQYFAGTTWSGCMIIVAMTFFSRISAIMMICGSIVGLFAAWFAGVDVNQIYSGGYSYDAALTAIGIGGFFYVISWKVCILAMMAAFFATWLHSGLQQWLAPSGLPALNLGFDITVILFVMIQFSLSGIAVIPLAKISQPEAHYFKTRTLAATLRALAAIEEMKEEQRMERELLFYDDMELQEQEQNEEGANQDYQPVEKDDKEDYNSDDLSL